MPTAPWSVRRCRWPRASISRPCRLFLRRQKTDGLVVSPLLLSRATGLKVIGSQIALHKPDGSFDGTLGITLDLHWFDYLLRGHPVPAGAVIAVFDRNGVVLASNDARVGRRHGRCRAQGRRSRRRLAGRPRWRRQCLAFRPGGADRQQYLRGVRQCAKTICSARPICMSGSISCCPFS